MAAFPHDDKGEMGEWLNRQLADAKLTIIIYTKKKKTLGEVGEWLIR